jgi:hypothetical protein
MSGDVRIIASITPVGITTFIGPDPVKVAALRAENPAYYARCDQIAGRITKAEADAVVRAARIARGLHRAKSRNG